MGQFNFIGGTFTAASLNQNAQRTYNYYPEKDESGTAKNGMMLVNTPGLTLLATLPTSPLRGLFTAGSAATNSTRLFAVAGAVLYELNSAGGIISARGNVGNDSINSPVQMFANGNQLLIISAGLAWLDNGSGVVPAMYSSDTYAGTVSGVGGGFSVNWETGDQFDPSMQGETITIDSNNYTVALVLNPNELTLTTALAGSGPLDSLAYSATIAGTQVQAVTGGFLDGYYIAQTPNSNELQISAINDGTSWNPIDFAVKEGAPDHIVSILVDHETMWLLGDNTSEAWVDTGAATFPLARDTGGFIQQGCGAPWTACSLYNGIAWVGADTLGRASAWFTQGYQPTRISTHAVEAAWSNFSTINDASAYVYEFKGHVFWVINFPTAGATWVYDKTEGLWHERGSLVGGVQTRHLASCHTFCFGAHYVGAFNSGAVYIMSETAYTDAGAAITRIRSAPHISDDNEWTFYEQLMLDIDSDIGSAFSVSLDYSDDGGKTFKTPNVVSAGAVSPYTQRVVWRRLGRSRDRVFRITITAAVRTVLINAYLKARSGAKVMT